MPQHHRRVSAGDTVNEQQPFATGTTAHALFSDAASAASLPAPRQDTLRPPLETLTWQAPPAADDDTQGPRP
ncbi:hypothetical protein [Streptomyces mirabilis]|uniref:hypothetical protein n=1 Tax=Streptomyces mirabilis TaxID=68239 RepID=UPI0036852254